MIEFTISDIRLITDSARQYVALEDSQMAYLVEWSKSYRDKQIIIGTIFIINLN